MNLRYNKDIPSNCEQCNQKGASMFCNLKQEELETVSSSKCVNYYKKGQIIYNEGNYPHGVYCMYEGKVKLHKLGMDGKEQIVRFAGKSNLLGYRALLSGGAYATSATAIEDTWLCQVRSDDFFKLIQQNTQFSLDTIKKLGTDLKFAENRLINMAQKTVRERVAEALLLIKSSFGVKADGKALDVTLTRKEIGSIAGSTTETTIRLLSDFQKESIITLQGKQILINNFNLLVREANLDE